MNILKFLKKVFVAACVSPSYVDTPSKSSKQATHISLIEKINDIRQTTPEILSLIVGDCLFSIKYQKWFTINHLPRFITLYQQNQDLNEIAQDLEDYPGSNLQIELCFWIATPDYNNDIFDIHGNLPIMVSDINESFLTPTEVVRRQRDELIDKLLS